MFYLFLLLCVLQFRKSRIRDSQIANYIAYRINCDFDLINKSRDENLQVHSHECESRIRNSRI